MSYLKYEWIWFTFFHFLSLTGNNHSLHNLAIAQSLSLNLKNLYSLEINLPATSTPAPLQNNSATTYAMNVNNMGDSYLNLINLKKENDPTRSTDEKEVASRKVEGSEVTEVTADQTEEDK